MSDRLKLTAKARHDAIAHLIANHNEEFTALYERERKARGLPPKTVTGELAYLRERVKEHEQREKELREAAVNAVSQSATGAGAPPSSRQEGQG